MADEKDDTMADLSDASKDAWLLTELQSAS